MPGHPQAALIFRPENIPEFEIGRRQPQVSRQPGDVIFGQVNKALLFAALRTPPLAFESQFFV